MDINMMKNINNFKLLIFWRVQEENGNKVWLIWRGEAKWWKVILHEKVNGI